MAEPIFADDRWDYIVQWWRYIRNWCLYFLGKLLFKLPRKIEVLGQYGDHPVVLDTPALWTEWHMGVPCAMVYINGANDVETIVVNKKALKWPVQVFEAILAHEAGHIELGHLRENQKGDDPNINFHLESHEFEADRWALDKHGYQYIYAMEYLQKWHDDQFLRERLKAVKRFQRAMIKRRAS
jgi:hypothetical protein